MRRLDCRSLVKKAPAPEPKAQRFSWLVQTFAWFVPSPVMASAWKTELEFQALAALELLKRHCYGKEQQEEDEEEAEEQEEEW